MSILIRCEAVDYYAARVRAELSGVDPEVIDDLTDGLEADLTEAILDGLPEDDEASSYLTTLELDALDARFGSPESYAAELAQAADVQVPDVIGDGAHRRGFRSLLADTRAGLMADRAAFVARHAWVRSTIDLLRSLEPAWWVLRGWGFYILAFALVGRHLAHSRHALLPGVPLGWLVLVGLVLVSVQLGRSRFASRHSRWRWLLGLVGAASGLAVLIGLVNLTSVATTDYDLDRDRAYSNGLLARENGVFIDGRPATNLFVYGPDGLPLHDVRILDQDGRPVLLGMPDYAQETWGYVGNNGWWYGETFPSAVLPGHGELNQYPYRYVPNSSLGTTNEGEFVLAPETNVPEAVWPRESLQPLAVEEATSGGLASEPEPALDSSSPTDPAASLESVPAPSGESTS